MCLSWEKWKCFLSLPTHLPFPSLQYLGNGWKEQREEQGEESVVAMLSVYSLSSFFPERDEYKRKGIPTELEESKVEELDIISWLTLLSSLLTDFWGCHTQRGQSEILQYLESM